MFWSIPHPLFHSRRVLAAALCLSVLQGAVAQSSQPPPWDIGNGSLRFLGCYAAQAGVQCDVVYTLTKVQAGLLALQADDVAYTTADGKTGEGRSVSIAGGPFALNSKQDSFSGKPIRAVFRLPLPTDSAPLRTLDVLGHRLTNVVISKGGAPTIAAPTAGTPNPMSDASGATSMSISGTIEAAIDLYGATVIACVRQNQGCASGTLRHTEITSTGPAGKYAITGLDPALKYTVIAWLDVDHNGDINSGDLLGTYRVGTQNTVVSAPHERTDFSLSSVD